MKTCIVMPVYNELPNIVPYIREIAELMGSVISSIILVDDASNDGTYSALREEYSNNEHVFLIRNEVNMGHGPSLIRGLKLAIKNDYDLVVTIDSDGEISKEEINSLIGIMKDKDHDLGIMIRRNRRNKKVRKIVSLLSKFTLLLISGKSFEDANTPFRVYRGNKLEQIISKVSSRSTVPNLEIRAISHALKLREVHLELDLSQKTKVAIVGSTWKNRRSISRYLKLVQLCIEGLIDLVILRVKLLRK